MKNVHCYFYLFLIGLLFTACQKESQPKQDTAMDQESHLGEVNFKVTGMAEAKPFFVRGLLLLHSFEYEDARAEFLKAQEIDSSFAMAYWGEAMTYNHSLWQRQEKELAVAALEKFADTPEERLSLAKTDLEKDFLQAVEILYGEKTKYERDLAYKDFMENLSKKYPEHHEVSAFYAISLLGHSKTAVDFLCF